MLVVDFNPQLTDYKTPAQKRFFTAIYYCVHWLAMSNSFVGAVARGVSGAEAALRHGRLVVPVRSGWT